MIRGHPPRFLLHAALAGFLTALSLPSSLPGQTARIAPSAGGTHSATLAA